LLIFETLQAQLVAYDLTLVKNDENDHSYGQHEHANCSEEQHKGYVTTLSIGL
jgi:hypothetical protein